MGTISKADYQLLVNDFNATDEASFLGNRLDSLFESVAEEHASNLAVVYEDAHISYHDLNASANRLARSLGRHGVERGNLVGLAVDRSIDLVVVMLAVLKLGAAYVPIDAAFPADRINQMVEDANPKLIVVTGAPTAGLACWGTMCLSIDAARASGGDGDDDAGNLGTDIDSRDLAYVIYTSGSTGRPKGVEISHGAAANFLTSLRRQEPGCGPHDRLLAITTISFDMSALELLLPLLSGATMVLARPDAVRDPHELARVMDRHAVTMMQATPATWTMLLESGWRGDDRGRRRLSKAICGGEAFPRRLADRLLTVADSVWNVYGPSETTYGSVGRVDSDDGDGDVVCVGHPVANGRIYVLGDDLRPLPMGGAGEVYIGGRSVSNGYRNQPELTRSRFLENPFHGGLFFRTGDWARFVGPGQLQVLGRIDGMVKIHGLRIETGDIEAAIVRHPAVSEAVVVSREDRLVAYCVLGPEASSAFSLPGGAAAAKAAGLGSALRLWLDARLPKHMVPAFFVPMDALPLSPNQKVDRRALPDPVAALLEVAAAASVLPATEMERQIQAVWAAVLGHDRFGVEDGFFEVGGDSIRLVRVQARLEKELGRHVSVLQLLEHFNVKALAAYLVGLDGGATTKTEGAASRLGEGGAVGTGADDIAVISMACRLPGGVSHPDHFWDILRDGRDAIGNVPKDRWNAEELYSADPDATGKSYCRYGGFLEDLDLHDPSFFGITPREAQDMTAVQHLVLELGWEAFERAGYSQQRLRGSDTGVFIGVSNNVTTSQATARLDGYSITGSADAITAGRLSYTLGLEGPSLTVDTACSSSLVSTHLACTSLRLGECDLALAGGASLLLTPGIHIEFSRLRGLSPDGRCRAFSADTQGTGFSEGASMVVLKRLADAQRDGDVIHAVLLGTAVGHGGRSVGLTAPNGPSQARLIRKTLVASSLQANDIDYIEAHGTATRLGDPIEGAALADVFGDRPSEGDPLWVGSAKSNIGHTGAAAGVTGLMKTILALRHGVLPRTLHATEPTPAVDWKGTGMALVQEAQPWGPRADRRRCAGISSFGIGGTGAHVVVAEHLQPAEGPPRCDSRPPAALFAVSGPTEAALGRQVTKLHQHVEARGPGAPLFDMAYSLATTRTHFPHRLVIQAQDSGDLLAKLVRAARPDAPLSSRPPVAAGTAMLFTGQGSQRLGMGATLYRTYPVFRAALDEVAAHFSEIERPLLQVMWAEAGSEAAALLDRTDYAQPALFALEVALWKLWQNWGVEPRAVLGHSVGEFAAAFAAGVLDLAGACALVAARGRLIQALPGTGAMVVLQTDASAVVDAIRILDLGDSVSIAGYNTPAQTVVSGEPAAADALTAYFATQGCRAKKLAVSHAFHSPQMQGILEDFRSVAQRQRFHEPRIAVVSGRTGRLVAPGELSEPGYWVQHIVDAVRFRDGIDTLAAMGLNVFVEIGPQPVLSAMGAECLATHGDGAATRAAWLPSLAPGKDESVAIQGSLAELHVRHVGIDWPAFFRPFACRTVELPTYAFQRQPVRPNRTPSVAATTEGTTAALPLCVDWQPVDTGLGLPPGKWALLPAGGSTSWTSRAAADLTQSGMQLISVQTLDEAAGLDGLLCLWDSDEEDVCLQARHFAAAGLDQLQMAARTESIPPLVWVTRGAVGTGADNQGATERGLGAAPLWGLLRTARNEHPRLRLRLVDLDDETMTAAPGALVHALALEAEPEIALSEGRALVPRLQPPGGAPDAARGQLVRSDGAVLITGGLGGFGARAARWLARAHGVRDLVLLSRRGAEAPGAASLVADLARLGAKATVVAGDVASAESVRSVMTLFSAGRPLRGLIHAAGTAEAGVLATLTAQRCAAGFDAKVDGAWHLHEATQDMDLDVFVVVSSIASVLGMPGLGAYAAANAFLDALMAVRRARDLCATSVAYGPLAGAGMATGLAPATRAHLSQFGLGALEADASLEELGWAARGGRTLHVVAALDLERLRLYFEDRGGVPPLYHSLLGPSNSDVGDPGSRLRAMLHATDPAHHADILLGLVREMVAGAMGFGQPEDVDVTRPLQDIGIDSLTAILTRNQLAALTGLTLSANIAFAHPNLAALSEALLFQMQEGGKMSSCPSPASGPSGPSGAATPATTAASTINLSAALPSLHLAAVREGCLDATIAFENTAFDSASPESVLVTGATGFVGAFLLHQLLRRGVTAHCLVRADSPDHARQRVIEALEAYGCWDVAYLPLVHPVVGDMARPLLGLDADSFDALADQVDAICHAGGLVDWMRPLDDYVGPNMVSTHEVLRLASRGRRAKAVHLISTVATLPRHLGYHVSEAEHEYEYATSKWRAERMASAARWRGAAVSVYRLPFVAAAGLTGHFRRDRGDFLHNLAMASLETGHFPSIPGDLSLVLPVDYLAQAVVDTMMADDGPARAGRDYDFAPSGVPAFDQYFGMLGGQDTIPFSVWREKALAAAATSPTGAAARIATVLDGCDDDTIGAMFKALPVGPNVLCCESYPVPLFGEYSAARYRERIRAV